MRTLRYVLWALVLVVGAATAGVWAGKTFLAAGSDPASGSLAAAFARSQYEGAGGPFTLIGTDGETVSAEDLRGKPFALFFGFTNCPDVCPTTLVEASGWLDALGEDADELRFVFVSVDPERDTPERLGRYVAAFDERIMGLTAASEETIAEVADRYRIVYEKVPLRNGGYTVNHTSDTLLFDADGSFAGFIPYLPPNMRQNETIAATETERTVARLRELIGA